MIASSSDTPVAAPLVFLAFGIFVVIVNRPAFTDLDRELHRVAEKRAKSGIVGALGGSGNAAQEYQGLHESRWLAPWYSWRTSPLWWWLADWGEVGGPRPTRFV